MSSFYGSNLARLGEWTNLTTNEMQVYEFAIIRKDGTGETTHVASLSQELAEQALERWEGQLESCQFMRIAA